MVGTRRDLPGIDDDQDEPPRPAFWTTRRALVAVVLLAILLRIWAVLVLPVDFDEPTYVRAGLDYAAALRAGDLGAVINYPGNREHPAFVKLLYAGGALLLGDRANATSVLFTSRAISAIFGVLAVVVVAWAFGPLAGGMLAVHTMAVKYTSQAYLEAVPLCLTILALVAASRAVQQPVPPAGVQRRWLWGSALALGMAAAGKVTYMMVVPVLAYLLLAGRRLRWQYLGSYLLVAALSFWLFNPTLWNDPLGRLVQQAGFYVRYTQSEDVLRAGYPWFQPLIWLGTSSPAGWHPEVFFYFGFDSLMCLLALGGLPHAWRTPAQRWLAIWLVSGIAILLLWPTRWPQYTLVLAPAVCVLAALSLTRLIRAVRTFDEYWGWIPAVLPSPPRYAWVALVLFVAFIAGVYGYALVYVALGSVGWSQIRAADIPLADGPVYDLAALPDGRVALATERGAVLWQAPRASNQPPGWQSLTTATSPLPSNRILALVAEQDGTLWLGTDQGVAVSRQTGWQVYTAAELGSDSTVVRALALGTDRRVWAGTSTGATVFDPASGRWTPLPQAGDGRAIFSVAVERGPQGDVIWFGGIGGVSRFDTASRTWSQFGSESGFSDAGVADLLIDSQGQLWAATLGTGLGRWDGQAWNWYTPANSELPSSVVTTLFESRPGVLWIGTSNPFTSGGSLTRVDQSGWRTYLPASSGYTGAEPLAMTIDPFGQLWIATRSGSVALYQLSG